MKNPEIALKYESEFIDLSSLGIRIPTEEEIQDDFEDFYEALYGVLSKFGEVDEEFFVESPLPKGLDGTFKDRTGLAGLLVSLLKFGVLQPRLRLRMGRHKALVDPTGQVEL